MAKNPFAALKIGNRATARMLRADVNKDFKVTQAGVDAIMSNLLTTQKGMGQKLTAKNAHEYAGLLRGAGLVQNKVDTRVGNAGGQLQNRFGTAIGASDPNLLAQAQLTATSGKAVTKGALKGLQTQVKAGNDAMNILKTAAKTAAASGQYELANALENRSAIANETIAANRLELQQMRLQDRLQREAEERAFEHDRDMAKLQARLAEGGGSGVTGSPEFEKASDSLIAEYNAGTITDLASLHDYIRKAKLRYGLSDKAVDRLLKLGRAYINGEITPSTSSANALAFTEEFGESPSAYLGPEQTKEFNDTVGTFYKPGEPVPDDATMMQRLGIRRSSDGSFMYYAPGAPEGVEATEQWVRAAVAYGQSTWMRWQQAAEGIDATTGAVSFAPAAGEGARSGGAGTPRPESPRRDRGATTGGGELPTTGYVPTAQDFIDRGLPVPENLQTPEPMPGDHTNENAREQYVAAYEQGVAPSIMTLAYLWQQGAALRKQDYDRLSAATGLDARERYDQEVMNAVSRLVGFGLPGQYLSAG